MTETAATSCHKAYGIADNVRASPANAHSTDISWRPPFWHTAISTSLAILNLHHFRQHNGSLKRLTWPPLGSHNLIDCRRERYGLPPSAEGANSHNRSGTTNCRNFRRLERSAKCAPLFGAHRRGRPIVGLKLSGKRTGGEASRKRSGSSVPVLDGVSLDNR